MTTRVRDRKEVAARASTRGKGQIRSTNRKGVRSGKRETSQVRTGGEVRLRGSFALVHEEEIRRRIANVVEASGAEAVSLKRNDDGFDLSTPTQELAHRIVTELEKAFRGVASYHWGDAEGSLRATWRRDA